MEPVKRNDKERVDRVLIRPEPGGEEGIDVSIVAPVLPLRTGERRAFGVLGAIGDFGVRGARGDDDEDCWSEASADGDDGDAGTSESARDTSK